MIILELKKLQDYEIINFIKEDLSNILEYKISRTADKRLILEMKIDISDSSLELTTFTSGTSQEKALQSEQ